MPTYVRTCIHTVCALSFVIAHSPCMQALCLSSLARKSSTTGEIVNLMAIDAQRFMDLTTYLHILWSGPFQISLSIIFLYQTMGASSFAGVALMVLMMPLNAVMGYAGKRYQVSVSLV